MSGAAGKPPEARGRLLLGLVRTDLPATPPDLPHQQAIILGGEDPFLPHLRASLGWARDADLAVAFVLESGVRGVIEHLRDLLRRGGRLRMVAGDYLPSS